MTQEEFRAFKKSLAIPAVKYRQGKIDAEELYGELFVVLGEDTFTETAELLEKAKKVK